MKTATQLEMAAMTDADAFGPSGARVPIAGRECFVRVNNGAYSITSPDGTIHDFRRDMSWSAVSCAMMDYFRFIGESAE